MSSFVTPDGPYDPRPEPVAVIGAGVAGLITAHTLIRDGFTEVVVFTRDDSVGGVWNDDRVYPGLQVNSVHGEFSLSPLAMSKPENSAKTGGRLSGADMNAYMKNFAEMFLEHIRFETEVLKIRRGESGKGWRIDIEDKKTGGRETLTFSRIVLCTGGCSTPTIPKAISPAAARKAHFDGPVFHSMQFKSKIDELLSTIKPVQATDDAYGSVIVVGGGKSAQDMCAYLANEGRRVTNVFDVADSFLASPTALPDFLRKSRILSLMSPHIHLRTRWERFLHTTWLGNKIVHAFWNFLMRSSLDALEIPADSPLRRVHSPFWGIRTNDEGIPQPNRFHMLANAGKIELVSPARMAGYGEDGRSVVLSDGRALKADAVILATGYSSSWTSIFDDETRDDLGLERHPPNPETKYHWEYKTLENPPPAHLEGESWAPSIVRGLVPAKNITRRDFAINGAVFTTGIGMTCEVASHWISSYFLGDKMRIPKTVEEASEQTERDAAWIRQRYPDMLLWMNESYTSSIRFWTWPQNMDDLLEDMYLPSMRSGGNFFTWPFKVVAAKELVTLKEERDAKRLSQQD